eukprot:241981-Chlamydomonas_euryale.AAC.8
MRPTQLPQAPQPSMRCHPGVSVACGAVSGGVSGAAAAPRGRAASRGLQAAACHVAGQGQAWVAAATAGPAPCRALLRGAPPPAPLRSGAHAAQQLRRRTACGVLSGASSGPQTPFPFHEDKYHRYVARPGRVQNSGGHGTTTRTHRAPPAAAQRGRRRHPRPQSQRRTRSAEKGGKEGRRPAGGPLQLLGEGGVQIVGQRARARAVCVPDRGVRFSSHAPAAQRPRSNPTRCAPGPPAAAPRRRMQFVGEPYGPMKIYQDASSHFTGESV